MMRTIVLSLVALFVLAPTLAGLWETLRAAVGVLPALGYRQPSVEPWRMLAGLPGVWTSVRLTLTTGFAATILSLGLASGLAALIWARWGLRAGGRLLAPLLAVPHAALAIGLAFLIAPSGWIARLLSPGLTGWQTPPDWATVQDPAGGALILGLVLKETAFLTLVMLAALGQLPVNRHLAAARALGWGTAQAWALVIWPQLYPMIRLPVLVVLSYSLSVVDVALILGPGTPPTLAVAMLRWFSSPDLSMMLPASAAALALAGIVLVSVMAWIGVEKVLRLIARRALGFGPRLTGGRWVSAGFGVAGLGLVLIVIGAGLAVLVWSFSFRWGFPDALPTQFTLSGWQSGAGWSALGQTLLVGVPATAISLGLAALWLEAEDRRAKGPFAIEILIYLPLLVPQVAFLFGLNVVALRHGMSGGLIAVIWAHAIFVLPYAMIALAGPWRRLDPELLRAGAALGAGPWRRFFTLKLPLLLRPLLVAAAVGLSVSVAQYLPTLFLGAGRVATLTTEAVALASGADRRLTAVHAILQMLVPMAGFALAAAIPGVIYHNRRGMRGGGAA